MTKRVYELYLSGFLKLKKRIDARISKKLWKVKKKFKLYELVEEFKKLPVPADGVYCIHSSLSQIGRIEGGASTVVQTLLEGLGEKATTIIPTFTLPKATMEATLSSEYIFDSRSTPSTLGAIPEAARITPGFIRSTHPTHSVVAHGPYASELVKEHQWSLTPTGFNSPFYKMSFMENAFILLLGSPFGNFTAGHCLQDRLKTFPYRPYTRNLYNSNCISSNGTEVIVKTYAHSTRANKYRWDRDEITRRLLELELKRLNVIQYFVIGNARTLLINCLSLQNALEKLLTKGITIFGPWIG